MRKVALASALVLIAAAASGAARVGDLVRIRGVRESHLVGLGLVVGLRGTGDRSPATREAVRRFAASCGLETPDGALDAPNSALATLTAELPAFAREGSRIDVTVSACGDASSLAGGVLLSAPLWAGRPEQAYVRAQGPVSTGDASLPATVGRIPRGGIVEREPPPVLMEEFTAGLARGLVRLDLKRASPQAASAVAAAVSRACGRSGAVARARAVSPGEVELELGERVRQDAVAILADVLELEVDYEPIPQVVVNERELTVAASGSVELAPAAVSSGSLSVTIGRRASLTQGAPAAGKPLVALEEGVPLEELVRELQRIQVSPRDLIAILKGLVEVGALRAEIVVQ